MDFKWEKYLSLRNNISRIVRQMRWHNILKFDIQSNRIFEIICRHIYIRIET